MLRAELEKREQFLREIQEERDTLLNELEELDRQNQQATQVWFELVQTTLGFFEQGNGHFIVNLVKDKVT